MVLEELIDLLKKRGVHDTFQILSQFKNNKAERSAFYKEFKKISYYNGFLRVKDKLIEKVLIKIEKVNNKTYIRLTKKGKMVLDKLVELNNLLKE